MMEDYLFLKNGLKKNIDKIISEVVDLIDKSNDLTKKIDGKS